MKRIIVPTDFSPEAGYALEVAKEVASHLESSEIILVNIVETPSSGGFSSMGDNSAVTMDDLYTLRLIEKTRDDMMELIAQPQFRSLDIKIKIKVQDHDKSIAEEICAVHGDMIIMGSEGVSGIEEYLMGSTAEKVVRLASCPVITIKTKPQNFRISNMIYVSTFNEESSSIQQLKDLQDAFAAQIHLLFINKNKNREAAASARERMERFAIKNHLQNFTINIEEGSYNEQSITRFASNINADVIAMPSDSKKGFMHFIMGSITDDLVNHSKTMTFTFNLKEAVTV